MASRDYTYCIKECEVMECVHNKKHLAKLGAVSAISWYNYPECEKGVLNDKSRQDVWENRLWEKRK